MKIVRLVAKIFFYPWAFAQLEAKITQKKKKKHQSPKH